MTVRYSTQPVVSEQLPGNQYAVVAGSYYDDEPAVWCRILNPGRNRDYRAVIVEPGDRHGKMVFVAATAGPDKLKKLVGHLVLIDLEREKDRVCFGTLSKLALATICDGIPGSTCRPDLRPCAVAVDSVHEAESRLLAEMDKVLAAWLKKTAPNGANATVAEGPARPARNKWRRRRLGRVSLQAVTSGV